MNTNSHAHVAVILQCRLKKEYGIRLPRQTFVVANCRPDFSIKYKKIPHYRADMYEPLCDMIRDLASSDKERLNAIVLANRLGVICHYICDFFCYAHTERFTGSLREHLQYESQLNLFLKQRRIVLHEMPSAGLPDIVDVEDVIREMDVCYNRYFEQTPSYANDILYSMAACERVIAPLLQIIVCKSQLSQRRVIQSVV